MLQNPMSGLQRLYDMSIPAHVQAARTIVDEAGAVAAAVAAAFEKGKVVVVASRADHHLQLTA
jgi:hypothetical protein